MNENTKTAEPQIPLEELHAALERLPEKYRLPLLLHHIEGRTEAETAALLGCSLSAASVRLTRGREMLRIRLAKQITNVSVAAVTTTLAGKAPASVSPAWIATIAHSAHTVVAGKAAASILKPLSKARNEDALLGRTQNSPRPPPSRA